MTGLALLGAVALWFALGYVAVRMDIFYRKNHSPSKNAITWMTWLVLVSGLFSWFFMVTVGGEERARAHFLPKFRIPLPRFSQELMESWFGVRNDTNK